MAETKTLQSNYIPIKKKSSDQKTKNKMNHSSVLVYSIWGFE